MAYPRLPDAELEIMKVVWQNGGGVTSSDVSQALKGSKDWAITTILHFLARLVDRGYLTVERIGKANVYSPLVAKADYLESEGKSLLERLYGNSLKDLVISLYDGNAISADDLEELRRYLDEKAGDAS